MHNRPQSVEDFRRVAQRRLPRAIFDYVDGGAEDESTIAGNRTAFQRIALVPRVHEDARPLDLGVTLCGRPLSMPLLLAPTGNSGLVHPDGDLAAVHGAAGAGIAAIVSGVASYSIEELGAAAPAGAPPWYQLYCYGDREFYGHIIDRAAAAGFEGLVVTVDVPRPGRRERDIANGFTVPPRLTARNAHDLLRHPSWTLGVVRHRRVTIRLFSEERPPLRALVRSASSSARAFTATLGRTSWDDVGWIRDRWKGPLSVKGILAGEDARRAAECGADAIVVSNHGGRQLDGAIASLDALPDIATAVGGAAQVVLDGGIRRGTDIAKALCLGADAVAIGRPWLYGLAAGGTRGVAAVLDRLRTELATTLELLGEPCARHLDSSFVRRLPYAASQPIPTERGRNR
jgi:isopentenyl diphosphate isomerase/L-lactate dehydrogenase-like FMN-dependent dehydrogenase